MKLDVSIYYIYIYIYMCVYIIESKRPIITLHK